MFYINPDKLYGHSIKLKNTVNDLNSHLKNKPCRVAEFSEKQGYFFIINGYEDAVYKSSIGERIPCTLDIEYKTTKEMGESYYWLTQNSSSFADVNKYKG
jgi:hypothetical protein